MLQIATFAGFGALQTLYITASAGLGILQALQITTFSGFATSKPKPLQITTFADLGTSAGLYKCDTLGKDKWIYAGRSIKRKARGQVNQMPRQGTPKRL